MRVLEPLALDRRVTEVLNGRGRRSARLPVRHPREMSQPHARASRCARRAGFRNRVAGLLRRLVDAVRTDTAPPADALGLVNLTTPSRLPARERGRAYRGAVVEQEVGRPG